MTYKEVFALQKQPLHCKIAQAVGAIAKGFEVSRHNTAIAFSGGKDSTVLWHLIRTNFPDKHPKIIFGNTGVEYPESLKFARQLGKEWGGEDFHETKLDKTSEDGLKYTAQKEVLEWLVGENRIHEILKADGRLKSTMALERAATPEMWDDFRIRNLVWREGTPMSYWWCIDQYGFPIMGKAASKLDARRINIDCFLRFSESASDDEKLLEYYGILRECHFSQHCCKLLKKDPSEKLQAELDVDVIFKGLMAAESKTRLTNFATRGYLFKSSRKHLGDDPFYHCNPISIWTDDDIWEYSRLYNVPQSPLYNMGWIDKDGKHHTIQRNGCFGCATDILYKDNHMAMLRRTHPRLWETVMKAGMADELKKLAALRRKGTVKAVEIADTEWIIENRPCAFDNMSDLVNVSGLLEEYDPEEDTPS